MALMLSACSPDGEGQTSAQSAPTNSPSPSPSATGGSQTETIACAVDGTAQFTRDCEVEQARVDGALVLVVRHPDGGFRRFDVLDDGRGLATTDGAEDAKSSLADNILEVSVANDRYRFPVTLTENGAP